MIFIMLLAANKCVFGIKIVYGFPVSENSLTVSVAAFLIMKRDGKDYLWRGRHFGTHVADGHLVS